MKASQICETTEWITHRDLANKIYMHTGNRQLAMEFYNLEDEFVSQDDMQSTGLKAFDVDPFEEDKARVNRILSIKRVPFRVLAMKHNDQYETLYSIVAPAMAESMYISEAQRVFIIVRKKDGALLQKFDSKKNAEKELIAGTGYSPATHYIKAMIDPQQAKAEKDPTHIGEADIRAFPTPEDYPIAKMDKLLSRYGVNYSMFINKPFDIKLYELLIDIYMNWEGSRIDRGALYYLTNQYRDRGVRAGELPPSDK